MKDMRGDERSDSSALVAVLAVLLLAGVTAGGLIWSRARAAQAELQRALEEEQRATEAVKRAAEMNAKAEVAAKGKPIEKREKQAEKNVKGKPIEKQEKPAKNVDQ